MNFDIKKKAQEDLENIWLFTIEKWSQEQADRYINLIFDEIAFLCKNPLIGNDISDVRKNYRFVKVKAHLIFYRFNKKHSKIEVIRILHERMDIDNRIK